ncbi:DUF2069 domain-containing protein [Dokdonella sp.]|uniref:DUF2069 domain-containing protein n=1 Tax=Dokdonella sp. TaxID=2291710 RepID=UPI003784D194
MNARSISFATWAALVLLQPAWYLLLAPPAGGSPWLALALTVPPLLLPLTALRSGPRRALLWIGIVALFYFCHGIVAAWVVPSARLPALIETALCVVLIAAFGYDTQLLKRKATASRSENAARQARQ